MRKVISACLVVAALIGQAHAAPPPPAAPAGDPAAIRITGSENYIPTFGLRASISRGFGVAGVLAVDAGLDIPNRKDRQQASALKPRIVNALRDAVLNYASKSYIIGERPNLEILRGQMQRSVDAILGPEKATVALASVIVFDR